MDFKLIVKDSFHPRKQRDSENERQDFSYNKYYYKFSFCSLKETNFYWYHDDITKQVDMGFQQGPMQR